MSSLLICIGIINSRHQNATRTEFVDIAVKIFPTCISGMVDVVISNRKVSQGRYGPCHLPAAILLATAMALSP